jgi:hypothetical protein
VPADRELEIKGERPVQLRPSGLFGKERMKKVFVLDAGVIVAAAFNGRGGVMDWRRVAKDSCRHGVAGPSGRCAHRPSSGACASVNASRLSPARCRTARSPQRSYGDRAASPAFAFGVSSSGTTDALGA